MLGDMWRTISAQEKAPFLAEYAKLKLEYTERLKAYVPPASLAAPKTLPAGFPEQMARLRRKTPPPALGPPWPQLARTGTVYVGCRSAGSRACAHLEANGDSVRQRRRCWPVGLASCPGRAEIWVCDWIGNRSRLVADWMVRLTQGENRRRLARRATDRVASSDSAVASLPCRCRRACSSRLT